MLTSRYLEPFWQVNFISLNFRFMIFSKMLFRGASGYSLVSHRCGRQFTSWSIHESFVVTNRSLDRFLSGVSPVFSCDKLHSTIPPHSSFISFHFIASGPVMMRHAWSTGNLVTCRPSNIGATSQLNPRHGCVGQELRIFSKLILIFRMISADILNKYFRPFVLCCNM